MNILFVLDDYPFPPRNGVTIPTANWIRLFSSIGYRVDLLILDGLTSDKEELVISTPGVGVIERIPFTQSCRAVGLLMELLGFSAVFQRWTVVGDLSRGGLLESYDYVWASPIRAFAIWKEIAVRLGIRARFSVAAVNDSYSLALRALAKRKRNLAARIIYSFRANSMKRIERRILRGVDLIGVQSTVEMNYFETVLDKNRTGDVLVIKNGVGDSFFEDRLERKFDLLFVGTLDDNYRPTIHWFIREVYASFSEPRPTFALIGSLANEDDLRLFREFNIVYLGFVDDVGVCYRSSRILVAPVFKGFGTINKVLEGMAAGCVVIGDSTAFNGIENFVPGRDGLVATTAAEFAANIVSVLGNDVLADEIGARARNLMKEDFSWRSRLDLVLDHFCWFSQIPEVE